MPSQEQLALAGLAIMAAAEVPNFLAGLLPSTMTIGRFAADPIDRARLRRSEVVGSGLAVAVGVGASLVGGHPLPFFAAMGVLAVLLYEYERAIRGAQSSGRAKPINDPSNIIGAAIPVAVGAMA
jgi:hypothetical protein